MSERVLVTGGAGFIGSHLVEALLDKNYRVRVLDNLSQGNREWIDPRAEFIEGDITDRETCRQAVAGCSGIFHMAAMSRSGASLDNIEICTTNNIVGTQNILTAAREHRVHKVVYSGSSTFYGNQQPPHLEDMRPNFLNFYGLSKYVGEEYCLMFDRMYEVPCVILRYFNVYGPRLSGDGAYALVLSIFLKQFATDQPLTIHGDGSQKRDFVHVRDVAEANIRAWESPCRARVYNIGTGTPVSIREVADQISSDQVFLPRRGGDAEITEADVTRTARELGWRARISFDQGLRELLALVEAEKEAQCLIPA